MWEYRCQHTNRDGSLCRRPVKDAVWCFEWEGEKFPSATWIEACGEHLFDAGGIVSTLQTRRSVKA